ncbi:hypothetical protein CTI12_AA089080 [Artemisia annua]|uniref:Ulp1 protease family, C-terminal catalytic domain-containing protein n=1 Tax=Artemisia annua TaxID=35608 RepID=A0A2U1Q0Z6_ARTAN|nr:hypothetical protein CTI12_AA089080 [Artemisia annua]
MINDEPKETEVADALKKIRSSGFLKETTTSTKGDADENIKQPKSGRKKQVPRSTAKKVKRVRKEEEMRAKRRLKEAQKKQEAEEAKKKKEEAEIQKKKPTKRKVQEDKPDETPVTKKNKRKIDESDSPSTRTRGASQRKLEEAYEKMKATRKRKVDEGRKQKEYKKKKAAGKRKVNEGKAADNEEPIDEEQIQESIPLQASKTLRGRETSAPLFKAMRNLSAERKRMIREMGFGELIDFPIVDIPTKLAFFVVNSLETKTMCLKLPEGDILILPETVQKVIEIPMGERPLQRQEGERGYDDPFLAEWKSQFPEDTKRITTKNVSEVIVETTNTDYMFKMNFLMLFANTMGCCDNSSCVKNTVLNNVLEDDNVREIDWCTYIWECARSSKHEWTKRCKTKDVVYYGPMTFLMLVYLHYTKFAAMEVRRRIPAFKSWNSTLMKKRETLEMNKANVGKLKVIGEMNEEEQSLQTEDLYQMIKSRIENIVSDKEMLEQTIEENLKIFKDDVTLNQFKKIMWHLFKQLADHVRDLNLQSSSQSTPTSISAPETDDNDDDGDSFHFEFQHRNQNILVATFI